jgi:hypothetical protein
MGAAAPSCPPPASVRPKHLPLRAGARAKLNPRRRWARDIEHPIVSRVLGECRVSPHSIADAIGRPGDDKAGKAVLESTTPLTAGEVAYLLELEPACRTLAALLRDRVGRELTDMDRPTTDTRLSRLRVIAGHLDIVEALLRGIDT